MIYEVKIHRDMKGKLLNYSLNIRSHFHYVNGIFARTSPLIGCILE